MTNLVETEKTGVLVVSEANLKKDNVNIDVNFKLHNVEYEFLGYGRLARIVVLINKELTYKSCLFGKCHDSPKG